MRTAVASIKQPPRLPFLTSVRVLLLQLHTLPATRESSLATADSSNAWEYSILIKRLREHVGLPVPTPEPVLEMSPLPVPRSQRPLTKSPFELHVGAAVQAQPGLQLHPSTLLETPLVDVDSVQLTASEQTVTAAKSQLSSAGVRLDNAISATPDRLTAAATAAEAGPQSPSTSDLQLLPCPPTAAAPDWHALGLLNVANSIYGRTDSTQELPSSPAAGLAQDWLKLGLIDLHSADDAGAGGAATQLGQGGFWLECAAGAEAEVTEWLNGSVNGIRLEQVRVCVKHASICLATNKPCLRTTARIVFDPAQQNSSPPLNPVESCCPELSPVVVLLLVVLLAAAGDPEAEPGSQRR